MTKPNGRETKLNKKDQLHQDKLEALANRVIDCFAHVFAKLKDHRNDIAQLRQAFKGLKKSGKTIAGCRTWEQFCTQKLNRDIRTIEYLLSGGNPVSKRKQKPETVSPKSAAELAEMQRQQEENTQHNVDEFMEALEEAEPEDQEEYSNLAIEPKTKDIFGKDYPKRDWDAVVDSAVTQMSEVFSAHDHWSVGYILKEAIDHRAELSVKELAKLVKALYNLSDDAQRLITKLKATVDAPIDEKRAA